MVGPTDRSRHFDSSAQRSGKPKANLFAMQPKPLSGAEPEILQKVLSTHMDNGEYDKAAALMTQHGINHIGGDGTIKKQVGGVSQQQPQVAVAAPASQNKL